MNWIKHNWKRVAKYAGLGLGCVVVALLAFVGARYVSAGSVYPGELMALAPAEVSVIARVDNVPNRKLELESLLDYIIAQPNLARLEASPLWRDSAAGENGTLADFRDETWRTGVNRASRDAQQAGVTLFDDVLGGELILCADTGEVGEFIALSRVSRGVRFRFSFLDIASGFLPSGPNAPKFEYSGGILRVTPQGGETYLITILQDVLAISNSPRLLNATTSLHNGSGQSADAAWKEARSLINEAEADRHLAGVLMNLDRMRERLPAEEGPNGEAISPVDGFNSLPRAVRGIYPDIFVPVNRILEQNLDSRPFRAAYYGVDITEPSAVIFDQYLLVDQTDAAREDFSHLRRTWALPAADATHLELLPPDTMFQASYRQPIEVLQNEVFDDEARGSLVGDFFVALRAPAMKSRLTSEVEEFVFAAAPRSYAPGASIPLSGTDFPLPAFALMFRAPGASPELARTLLEEYLLAQRGRVRSADDDAPVTGRVTVIERRLAGGTVYGFNDDREEGNFITRLNRSIRAGVVNDWLILTNSEQLLGYALNAARGSGGLARETGSAWRMIPSRGSASLYVSFNEFADYAGGTELARILRDNRYNTGLIDGRDPGEVRAEIAAGLGTDDLADPQVTREFNERRTRWLHVCNTEGERYEQAIRANLNATRLLRDVAMITTFADNHLHVRGVLRIGG